MTYTVEAENATSYKWQYKKDGGEFKDSGNSTAGKATLVLTLASDNINNIWRCVINDGQAISDEVKNVQEGSLVKDGVTYEALTATTCRVVSYAGTASSLTIPEKVQGMTVVEIGPDAFKDNKYLESIDLPDTITVIGARAFKNCSKLSDMH